MTQEQMKRALRDCNAAQVARNAGIGRMQVSRFLHGKGVKPEALEKLAKYLERRQDSE